jgi:hypothetical protein
MALLRLENCVVILVSVGSAFIVDIQFVMQREAQPDMVWFFASVILPIEAHVASLAPVLLCETGLPFSSDDL